MTLRKGQVINFFILNKMALEKQEKVKNIKQLGISLCEFLWITQGRPFIFHP